jgi:hypothetical protein
MNWDSVYDHVHRDPAYRAEAELRTAPVHTRSADDEAAIEGLRYLLLARARLHAHTAIGLREAASTRHHSTYHSPRACIAMALALLL